MGSPVHPKVFEPRWISGVTATVGPLRSSSSSVAVLGEDVRKYSQPLVALLPFLKGGLYSETYSTGFPSGSTWQKLLVYPSGIPSAADIPHRT